jgi:hypothetical protein
MAEIASFLTRNLQMTYRTREMIRITRTLGSILMTKDRPGILIETPY